MVDVSRLEEALLKVVVRSLQMYNRYSQIIYVCGGGVHAVAQPGGRGFDSRWCHWNFSFRPHYGPVVDSNSSTVEYSEYFPEVKGGRCIGLTALPPSYADCLESPCIRDSDYR